jgi:hypothetical protein
MTTPAKNYSRAISEVAERDGRPKDAWRHLNDAKQQLEGAMVTAKWSQTLFPEEP